MNNTIIEILIDNSGSMGYMKGGGEDENKYLIDGQTRMTLIKQLLIDEIIPTIDYTSKVCIRTFRISIEKENNKIVQKDIEIPVIYEGDFNYKLIEEAISKLKDPPMGGTPISAALDKSFENLKNYPQHDRKIILLTDGEENGGGDYVSTAKKIETLAGIKCKIFIIGLALTEKSVEAAKEIASGGFYNIKSKSFKRNEIKQVMAPIKTAVLRDSVQNIAQSKIVNHQSPKNEVTENVVKDRIKEVAIETQKATTNSLNNLENKIKEYVSLGEGLLDEFSSLRENIRINSLIESNSIDSTTLTIDDEYSESIRQRSETFLYKILCEKYGSDKVNWLNKEKESYKPYDFELLDEKDNVYQYVECKGTAGTKPTFYMTDKEWGFFIKNSSFYQVYRIFNLDSNCNYFWIENLLNYLMTGKVVPYLTKPEILKENRVFLTLIDKE
jgi:hypothetical protein